VKNSKGDFDEIIDYEKAKDSFAIRIKSTVSAEHADI
jgi:hypothetical protein